MFNIQDESLQILTVGVMLTLSIKLLGLINRVDLDVLNRVCITNIMSSLKLKGNCVLKVSFILIHNFSKRYATTYIPLARIRTI